VNDVDQCGFQRPLVAFPNLDEEPDHEQQRPDP
jgi:hypothetical protein